MARKPYVPLNQNPECEVVPEKKQCDPGDRNVRAMVSADHGNSIQQRPDGLYAPAIVYRENTSVINEDGSVEVSEGTDENGYRQFTIGTRISLENGNILELREDGLFVSVEFPEVDVPLLVQGSLTYSPLIPGQGVIVYSGRRNVIRVVDGLTRLVLGEATEFEEMEEVYLIQDEQREMPITLVWPEGVFVDNVEGPSQRVFRAGASVHLLRHQGQEWLVLSGAGVDEAPWTGQPYVRKNGVWVLQHDQVMPVLTIGQPHDSIPLDITPSQFNRIVHIHSNFTDLQLHRQYIQPYQDDFEATFVKGQSFNVIVPMGVTVNNFAGPLSFSVDARPKGCVLKKVSNDNWLLLGAVQQSSEVTPLPSITTMEFPGSGTFSAVFRLLDGTLLYDMSSNAVLMSSVHALKNLIIACVVMEEKTNVLEEKNLVYLDSYKPGTLSSNVVSTLEEGDIISYRDLLSLLLIGNFEDAAIMISLLVGGNHTEFTTMMNEFVASFETPLVSSFFGASSVVADPVGHSTVYKYTQWLQYIEENYEVLRTLMRLPSRTFNVFGPNAREYVVENQNEYLTYMRNDYGLKNQPQIAASNQQYNLAAKLELPSAIPVYASVGRCATELERHLAYTSGLMSIEDDFPFLTGTWTDADDKFSNVTLLIGNNTSLNDRSNIQNQVFPSPSGITTQVRDDKGWIRSYLLNGSSGYISVYDNASLRLGSSEFTLEMFFRANENKTNSILFAKWGPNLSDQSYKLSLLDTVLRFSFVLEGGASVQNWDVNLSGLRATILSGIRRHICIQREEDTLGMYLNGRRLGTYVLPPGAEFKACAYPLNIGVDGDPLYSAPVTSGQYANIRVDNVRLTKGEARYDFAGFPVRTVPFRTGSGA